MAVGQDKRGIMKKGSKMTLIQRERISLNRKKWFKNPENVIAHKERQKIVMNKPEVKEKIRLGYKAFQESDEYTNYINSISGNNNIMHREDVREKHKQSCNTTDFIEGRSGKNNCIFLPGVNERRLEELRKSCQNTEVREKHTGKNNGRWLGGKSFEPYCPKFNKEFKERVRDFYGRTCMICGISENELSEHLSVHHVDYDKEVCCNNKKPMFVVLCRKHHSMVNNNRNTWAYIFKYIIEELYNGYSYLPKHDNEIKTETFKHLFSYLNQLLL